LGGLGGCFPVILRCAIFGLLLLAPLAAAPARADVLVAITEIELARGNGSSSNLQ
jgi:hypothetical protein